MADVNVPPVKVERAPKGAKEAAKDAASKVSPAAAPSLEAAAAEAAPPAAPAGFEMPDMLRALAEQSLERTRDTYARLRATAEETTDALEASFDTARNGLLDVQFTALDAAKANADAAFDLARKLLGVRSFADAVELQAGFARERFVAMAECMQDIQTTLAKVVSQSAAPAKTMLDKVASDFRTAA